MNSGLRLTDFLPKNRKARKTHSEEEAATFARSVNSLVNDVDFDNVVSNMLLISSDFNPSLSDRLESLRGSKKWIGCAIDIVLENPPFSHAEFKFELRKSLLGGEFNLSSLSYLTVISEVHPNFFQYYRKTGSTFLWFNRYVEVGNLSRVTHSILSELEIPPSSRISFLLESSNKVEEYKDMFSERDFYLLLSGTKTTIGDLDEEDTVRMISELTRCPSGFMEVNLSRIENCVTFINGSQDEIQERLRKLNCLCVEDVTPSVISCTENNDNTCSVLVNVPTRTIHLTDSLKPKKNTLRNL